MLSHVKKTSLTMLQIAKTDATSLGVGSDGILYKMLDHKDWDKFRTLSDRELQEEIHKSREIKENMSTLNGKLKNGKYGTSLSKSGIKLVAPQFGTQSRSKKIEKKNWEADVQTMQSGGVHVLGSSLRTGHDYKDTMQTLARNEQLNHSERYDEDEREFEEEPRPARFRPADGGFNVSQSADDRIQSAISAMKNKYEQNLTVVEKLFDEKKYMERKIELLEEKLRSSTAGSGRYGAGPEIHGDDNEEYDKNELLHSHNARLNATYGESPAPERSERALKQSTYEPDLRPRSSYNDRAQHPSNTRASAPGRTRGEETYSAADLASMLNPQQTRASTGSRPTSAPARRPPTGAAASKGRSSTPLGSSQNLRSSSASSRRSTGGGVSANLQADADRYQNSSFPVLTVVSH